jgi:RHS repeat-associated protein
MGSVTAILDEDGNVIERRSYDAFGEMTCMAPDGTPVAASPTGVDVGFQGQIRDDVTGLYQMGYRWYNPVLGRWISRDPIGMAAGQNLVRFVNNRPQDRIDSFGLKEDSTIELGRSRRDVPVEMIARRLPLHPQPPDHTSGHGQEAPPGRALGFAGTHH